MVYFTADLHFYHDNIISHTGRPFRSMEQMNNTLVQKWNAKISHQDEIYILGDVTMKGPELALEMLSRLRGKKHLIRGNHDRFADQLGELNPFVWIKDYAEVSVQGAKFILFHYPISEWNGFFRGSIHLHGHQHNRPDYNYENLRQGLCRYDVGVDANYMSPVSAEDILAFFTLSDA